MTPLTRPLPDAPRVRAYGFEDIQEPLGATLGAAAGMETLGSLFYRQGRIRRAERGGRERPVGPGPEPEPRQVERLHPETLNRRYSGLGLSFDEPMTEESAAIIASAKIAEKRRQDIISRGPSGALPMVAQFGAGLAAMAVDPLEVATAFIPVVGPGARAALAARAGRVGGRVAEGVIEGAVGNALTEPFVYGMSRSQQLDYGMSDALLNIGLGTALGGTIGAVAGVMGRRRAATSERALAAQTEPPFKFDPEAARVAVAQMATGRRVEVRDLPAVKAQAEPVMPKRPVTSWLRSIGGVDPDGRMAEELRAQGVTSQTMPGLFRRGGERDLDTVDAAIINEPEFTGRLRPMEDADGGARYVDPQSIADAVADETRQRPVKAGSVDMMAEARAEAADELSALGIRDATPTELDATARLVREQGMEWDNAYEAVVLQQERDGVVSAARQSEDVASDPAADVEASQAAARMAAEPFDVTEEDAFLMAALEQQRAQGMVSDAQLAEIDAAGEYVEKARAFGQAAKAAAACLTR